MKFLDVALSAVCASLLTRQTEGEYLSTDTYYHKKEILGPAMWHFNGAGTVMYSVDGSKVLKNMTNSGAHVAEGSRDDAVTYFSLASDGHRFVWGGSYGRPYNRVETFDIDTGEPVGYMKTCSTPLDLQYHPLRQEMWLRCAQNIKDKGHAGEIDVFSVNSLSSDFELINLNETARPYGRLAVHSSLGNYGFASAYNIPYLARMDLSSKEVVNEIQLPKAYGSYDMTYSPVNKHVYVRTRICCTCGSEDADQLSCGRGDGSPVLVENGPSASAEEQLGVCSSGCEGSKADTIGAYEVDTVSLQVVGNHNIEDTSGFGCDPVASPDGKFIVLLGNNAGKSVRIITPNGNGEKSSTAADIQTDFQGGTPGRTVVSDYAFIQDETRNILVLAASTDNNVVVVDLDDNYRMRKFALTSDAESSGGSSRTVEWAVDSNFVWVNGADASAHYILEFPSANIDDAFVARTLTDVAGGKTMYVENYERRATMEQMAKMIGASSPDTSSSGSASPGESNSGKSTTIGELGETNEMGNLSNEKSSDESKIDIVGIIALVVACVALVGNLVYVMGSSKSSSTGAGDTDAVSLGSKDVA
mmetsp:Transcript_46561/g.54414  ORF Transcript_46561/g.54414 Transcript_46561/m.54414 type:complete len:587 (+) Transcript_46561:43-1803(+)